jgi:hypothetical protein
MGVNPADLAGLTVIESTAAVPSLSDEQSRELARRRAEGLADPAATIDWRSVRQELFKKS